MNSANSEMDSSLSTRSVREKPVREGPGDLDEDDDPELKDPFELREDNELAESLRARLLDGESGGVVPAVDDEGLLG
jgi:hypothetical protein